MTETLRHLLMIAGALGCLTWGIREADRALFAMGYGERDVTDAAGARLNLGWRRDAGTGCEYLLSPYGGITPRLGPDGRAFCQAR